MFKEDNDSVNRKEENTFIQTLSVDHEIKINLKVPRNSLTSFEPEKIKALNPSLYSLSHRPNLVSKFYKTQNFNKETWNILEHCDIYCFECVETVYLKTKEKGMFWTYPSSRKYHKVFCLKGMLSQETV